MRRWSACTASVRPRTSSRRLRDTRDGEYSRSRARAIAKVRSSRARSAPTGLEDHPTVRLQSSTRRSSLRRSASSFPLRCAPCARAALSYAPGFTMSDIPAFPYELLWGERVIRSVANLTRRDGEAFLALAPTIPVRTETRPYALEAANEALEDLRHGRLRGAAVLVP